ncbi:MAG: hypothetical protein ACXWV0_06570 [Flavisolibacter sp.]
MNRRNFLQKTSLAAMAAASLPLAARARNPKQSSTHSYRSENMGEAKETLYGLSIDEKILDSFSSATEEEKTIMLSVKYYKTTDRETPSRSGNYKLMVESVRKGDQDRFIIETKVEKISSSYDLPKAISKKLTLKLKKLDYVLIEGKKDQVAKLKYVDASSGDEECFLTTACVHHKQLRDDCMELQTLRGLREHHMRGRQEENQLIRQYSIFGPAIVKGINNCENSAEIYDYMYTNMILPSVELVQQGKNDEAVLYYKTFVKALHEKYC